jgi:catechol 2,3-dioxygenase
MTTDTLTPVRTTEQRSHPSFERAAGEGALGGALIGAAVGTWLAPLSGMTLALYGAVFGAAVGSMAGLVVHALTSGRRTPSSAPSENVYRHDGSQEVDMTDDAREQAERPAGVALGAVHLTVSDLDRSLEYYTRSVGLQLLSRDGGVASLGAGETELLVLVEEPGARSAAGHTGLFHFALLVPQREDLATWLAHAARDRVPLAGLSDHFVSEALYLTDPDGHGIEIYWDRPRDVWEGQVAARMTTLPLDTDSLLGELDDPRSASYDGLPAGTTMGHVHLKVADIPSTIAFYRDVLDFELMARLGSRAAFLAADGYHHHIGANTWESAGASPPPPGTAALRHATVVLPDSRELDAVLERLERHGHSLSDSAAGPLVRDPSGNALLLAVASPPQRDS